MSEQRDSSCSDDCAGLAQCATLHALVPSIISRRCLNIAVTSELPHSVQIDILEEQLRDECPSQVVWRAPLDSSCERSFDHHIGKPLRGKRSTLHTPVGPDRTE